VRWPEDRRFVECLGDSFLCSDVFEGQNALEYFTVWWRCRSRGNCLW